MTLQVIENLAKRIEELQRRSSAARFACEATMRATVMDCHRGFDGEFDEALPYFSRRPSAAASQQRAFLVEVPPGKDGRIWCFRGPGNANSLGKVSVAGIPDYFALRPEQLLVPRETVTESGDG